MKALTASVLLAVPALAFALAPSLVAQEKRDPPPAGQPQLSPQKPAGQPTGAQPVATVPVYKPPLRGTPGGRVGGGTRGTGRETFVLAVLAPQHTGQTTLEQPSLYWFISSPTSTPVEVTVVDPRTPQPVVELRVPAPVPSGVHRISLADHGVRLAPGVAYRWFVAVVPDTGRRSKDVMAGAAIERVDPPQDLGAKLAGAAKSDRPFLYAEAGLWYDAVAALSELIDAEPQNAALRSQRAGLLTQVGLPDISQ